MKMLSENATIEEVREFFKDDKFASKNGCRIVEAGPGHAVTELDLDPELHYNAMGGVMGGVYFTLGDYALAVSCNYNEKPTVAINNTIEYFAPPKGSKLIATSDVDRSGRTLGFYTVMITDETGRKVAKMTCTVYR